MRSTNVAAGANWQNGKQFGEEPPEFTKDEYLHLKMSGYSDRIIARMYGKTVEWVIYRKKKWGLIGINVWQKRAKELRNLRTQYVTLLNKGYSVHAAAKEMKISRNTLSTLAKEWGLEVRRYVLPVVVDENGQLEVVEINGMKFKRMG